MKWIFSYKFCLMALLLVLLTSCKDVITNPGDLNNNSIIIELDKSEYKKDEIAELSVKNYSEIDLILGNCAFSLGFDIEKKINGNWVMPYSITCAAIAVPLIYIGKDSTFKQSIRIPIFESELDSVEGIYRLKLWIQDAQSRTLIADSLRVTNPFRIISD